MYTPKEDIYSALQDLGITILQGSQDVFTKTPAITFSVSDNSVELDLNNEISSQELTIVLDIWTESSTEASELLQKTEKIMRKLGYRLSYSADIPRPEGALHHINCRFEAVR